MGSESRKVMSNANSRLSCFRDVLSAIASLTQGALTPTHEVVYAIIGDFGLFAWDQVCVFSFFSSNHLSFMVVEHMIVFFVENETI